MTAKYLKSKLIGNKAFYKMVLAVAIPIMIQTGITNFVSLLDNIMVGQVGTEQMSGVAIVNQLIMVFNVTIFGALSGAGIFGAQFAGCKDYKGVRYTFRFKMYMTIIIFIIGVIILSVFGDKLILMYLHGEGQQTSLDATLHYGLQYMWIMLFGLLPFGIEQVYTSTLRECGETVLPMKAGIAAVLVNLVFNYILIFGHLGMPAMGVVGAAIATVMSRYVQVAIVIIWTHKHKERMPFIVDAYKSFRIPLGIVRNVFVRGIPLMVNEVLWSSGMAALLQCYSVRGINTVAALNISNIIINVFNIVFMAMGSAISIIVGQLLGAGKMEEAKDTDAKLIAFGVFTSIVIGVFLFTFAPVFPMLYKTHSEVKVLATSFIRVAALCMPIAAFMHASYFTLRSGGKTIITFIFDSVFLWCINIPVAYVLSRLTNLPIVPLYLICQLVDIIKCVAGFVMVKKGVWIQNLIVEQKENYDD